LAKENWGVARVGDGLAATSTRSDNMVNSLKPRARAAAAICVLIAAAALGGCGVGQQSQTATMAPDVNGSMATLSHIALRNIRIRAQQTGYAVQPGETVELVLVATNQSPVTADAVVAVTSDIGVVTVVGNTTIPAGGLLIVDSPDRVVHASALTAIKPAHTATATVILTKPISNGLHYQFTFRFAHAGDTTVGVPVSAD
jgi:hypothetical protein